MSSDLDSLPTTAEKAKRLVEGLREFAASVEPPKKRKNGSVVAEFEKAFAEYVGAKYAIALANGTCTLHTALAALGVKPGDRVAVPPLTMSATTIAVLHAGAVPVFVDVDERTWLYKLSPTERCAAYVPVDLYGLVGDFAGNKTVVDSAQTLRQANKPSGHAFTSYSFQASKILALGEGGMLVTDDEQLAVRAREFSSLGYRLVANQPRIDPATLKHPTFERHHFYPAFNYRMNDVTAAEGLRLLPFADKLIGQRRDAADHYAEAALGCAWLTPQFYTSTVEHDMWTYAVAADTPERALKLLDAVERHGGERPYPAWRLTYDEPAFTHLGPRPFGIDVRESKLGAATGVGGHLPLRCPVAESLQPRLIQFQTNDLASAEKNAAALKRAIEELS